MAEGQGIKLERHGADLIGLSPFDEDHNPSLVITPGITVELPGRMRRRRIGHRLGDAIQRGVSFRHALELLRANHPSLAYRWQ